MYVHRVVLFDKIGMGPHPCYRCDALVHWQPIGDQLRLVPDHLDDDPWNNDPSNLEPSCDRCNYAKAVALKAERNRERGLWSRRPKR